MTSILVVDDDQQILKLVTRILENKGYQTLVASDGIEAVKQYKSMQPDLLIIDIIMPEKEGIETIIELKQHDPDIKIIAISGGGEANPETYLKMAEKFGAAATIKKPIDKAELLEAVEKTLSI